MSIADDPNYLLFRATQHLKMPPGVEPSELPPNKVVALHKAVLEQTEIQQMILSGRLQAMPAKPVMPPPTAREVIEALAANPSVFEEVEKFFWARFIEKAKQQQQYNYGSGIGSSLVRGAVAKPPDPDERLEQLTRLDWIKKAVGLE